ncbi:MAG: hydrogenase iron-sulfur subunit [Deltaproteobacteria bacterium]|nr:hydrogenase iron-sulfur subunit [Deltaproteobacteria bacterium]
MDWIPRITIFHCINALEDMEFLNTDNGHPFEIRSVKMPCSGMTKEVYLLKAFEAGADAVVVRMCPEGECRFVEGNTRARKRIERVRRLLDEIGIQGDRLSAVSLESGNEAETLQMILRTVAVVRELGPNPAADPASVSGPTSITKSPDQDQYELTFAEMKDDCRRAETVCGNQKTRMAV